MNKKEFKKLQKEWYAKLDASGFDDIERPAQAYYWFDEYHGMMKRPTAKIRTTSRDASTTIDYYANLAKFAESRYFSKKYEKFSPHKRKCLRTIARLSADGYTIVAIQKHLRKKYPNSELKFSETYMYTNFHRLVNDAAEYVSMIDAKEARILQEAAREIDERMIAGALVSKLKRGE